MNFSTKNQIALALIATVLEFAFSQSARAAAFSTNRPMASARYLHTATLLTNGSVLVVGGLGVSGYLNNAEMFNPVTATWTGAGTLPPIGPYPNDHMAHTATLLTNGLVMFAGGIDTANIFPTAELFNPSNAAWSLTGDMNIPRAYHTATLLTNGLVLVAGGFGCCSSTNAALASAELYNPVVGTWTNTGTMTITRKWHTATLLNNGKVLIAGGVDRLGNDLSSAELYNPATGTWTATGTMTNTRQQHTATLLANGQVLVAGGVTSIISNAELYDQTTGKWSVTGSMNFDRYGHTATLLTNGQVLVIGGRAASVNSELYNPASRTWSVSAALNTVRYHHTAVMLTNGQVLVTGGSAGGLFPQYSSTEFYDLFLKAIATVTLSNLTQTYDGTAKTVSVTTTPNNLAVNVTYNGSSAAPTNIGSYDVIGIINDMNYQGGATNDLVINPPAINLNLMPLADGAFNLSFTNAPRLGFSVYGTTNLSLPLKDWDLIGAATEVSPGQYQFTDPQATNNPQRFYRIRSP